MPVRERLDHSETREATTIQDRLGKCLKRTRDTEPMDRILLWTVQSQGQWKSINTDLSPGRHRGRPPHPSQRNGGCSTIIDEREVSRRWQHPSRTGTSKWRGCNHHSHKNLQQDLEDRRMSNHVDPVLSPYTLRKKGNLQQCQNYRTISLISHSSKVMLKTIFDTLKLQAQKIIT